MKKFILISALALIGTSLFTSCMNSSGGGSSERYQVFPALRKGVIFTVDKNTGEVYRMKLDQQGNSSWSSLGSPADAK